MVRPLFYMVAAGGVQANRFEELFQTLCQAPKLNTSLFLQNMRKQFPEGTVDGATSQRSQGRATPTLQGTADGFARVHEDRIPSCMGV